MSGLLPSPGSGAPDRGDADLRLRWCHRLRWDAGMAWSLLASTVVHAVAVVVFAVFVHTAPTLRPAASVSSGIILVRRSPLPAPPPRPRVEETISTPAPGGKTRRAKTTRAKKEPRASPPGRRRPSGGAALASARNAERGCPELASLDSAAQAALGRRFAGAAPRERRSLASSMGLTVARLAQCLGVPLGTPDLRSPQLGPEPDVGRGAGGRTAGVGGMGVPGRAAGDGDDLTMGKPRGGGARPIYRADRQGRRINQQWAKTEGGSAPPPRRRLAQGG